MIFLLVGNKDYYTVLYFTLVKKFLGDFSVLPLPLYRHVCISYKLYLRIKESILTELNILPELNILTELNILSCLGDLLQGFKFGQV